MNYFSSIYIWNFRSERFSQLYLPVCNNCGDTNHLPSPRGPNMPGLSYLHHNTVAEHVRIWNPELKSGRVRIWNFSIEKLKSGHVRNWNFQLINENPDTSGFEIFQEKMEIRTRPDLYFSIDKYESGLAKFVMSSSPDFNFSIGKWKSGHVRIYILPLININPDWQNSVRHLVRILIFPLENENPDTSGFLFFNWK